MKARDLLLRKTALGLEADETAAAEADKDKDADADAAKADDAPADEPKDDEKEPAEEPAEGDNEAETTEEKEPAEVGDADSADADDSSAAVSTDSDSDDSAPADDSAASAQADDAVEGAETTTPVEGNVESSITDNEKKLLELNGFEVSDEEAEDAVEDMAEAQAALEAIMVQLSNSLATGGATRREHSLAMDFANNVCKTAGLESIQLGLESADTRYTATVAAIESIGEKIKEAGKAAAAFIKDLIQRMVSKVKGAYVALADGLGTIAERLKNLPDRVFDTTFNRKDDPESLVDITPLVNGDTYFKDLGATLATALDAYDDSMIYLTEKQIVVSAEMVRGVEGNRDNSGHSEEGFNKLAASLKEVYETLKKQYRFDKDNASTITPGSSLIGVSYHTYGSDRYGYEIPDLGTVLIHKGEQTDFSHEVSLRKLGLTPKSVLDLVASIERAQNNRDANMRRIESMNTRLDDLIKFIDQHSDGNPTASAELKLLESMGMALSRAFRFITEHIKRVIRALHTVAKLAARVHG